MSVNQNFIEALPELPHDVLTESRQAALTSLAEQGLPNRRVEAFKYTDLSALETRSYALPPRPDTETVESLLQALPEPMGLRVLILDGWCFIVSREIADYAFAMVNLIKGGGPGLPDRWNASPGLQDHPLAVLNTAQFRDGLWFDLPHSCQLTQPVEVIRVHRSGTPPLAVHNRLLIRLGKDSRMTLIERAISFPDAESSENLATRVCEIQLAQSAQLRHYRSQESSERDWLLDITDVDVDADAHYELGTLDLGSRVSRHETTVRLNGTGAKARINGAALPEKRQHIDNHVTIHHHSGKTWSRQHIRSIVQGRSQSIYTGRVVVEKDAQASDSAQQSANLVLSPRAEAVTRPQLEIYADDVKCSHGAATGEPDPDALFYLRARGLSESAARAVLSYAFAWTAFQDLADETALEHFQRKLIARLNASEDLLAWK